MGIISQIIARARMSIFTNFIHDNKGNLAIFAALVIPVVLMTVGMVYDLQQLTKARAIAQAGADNMALMAAIAVENREAHRYKDETWYEFKDIGGGKDFTHTMQGKVSYDLVDPDNPYNRDEDGDGLPDVDDPRLMAKVKVRGNYKPAFLNIIGKDNISFSVESEVTYKVSHTQPASIGLILDNSGSMAFDEAGGEQRLDRLKSIVHSFMTDLENQTQSRPGDPRTLRTGMMAFSMPYSQCSRDMTRLHDVFFNCQYGVKKPVRYTDRYGIFKNSRTPMRWGAVPKSKIDKMVSAGGTEPAGALWKMNQWLWREGAAHKREGQSGDVLKFLVLMTDGQLSGADQVSRSLKHCRTLKKNGVVIFTIGYALTPGRATVGGNPTRYWISQQKVKNAQDFLRACASDESKYIQAASGDALSSAFRIIGQEITSEVIRVKK